MKTTTLPPGLLEAAKRHTAPKDWAEVEGAFKRIAEAKHVTLQDLSAGLAPCLPEAWTLSAEALGVGLRDVKQKLTSEAIEPAEFLRAFGRVMAEQAR